MRKKDRQNGRSRDEIEAGKYDDERAEQAELMGKTDPKEVFEADVKEFANAAESDGYAPCQFLSRHAFEKLAHAQGKPVTKEQVAVYYGVDETMPAGAAVCWLCDKPVAPRKWAVAGKNGFIADRDSESGAPLMVAAATKRYDKDGRPFVAVACGSAFDPDSHLTLTREVKRTEPDGTLVYFLDGRGKIKPRRLGLYGKVKAEVDAELGQLSGKQAAITRLGGLVNREKPTGGGRVNPFRPSTPRGERRGGGNTPQNRGNWGR